MIHFGRIRRVTHFQTKCPRDHRLPQHIHNPHDAHRNQGEVVEPPLGDGTLASLPGKTTPMETCLRMFEDHRSRLAPPEVVKSVWYRSIADFLPRVPHTSAHMKAHLGPRTVAWRPDRRMRFVGKSSRSIRSNYELPILGSLVISDIS